MSNGAPSISDVLNIANFREKTIDRRKNEAFEKEAAAHLKGFTELGPDYSPEGEYDSRAFIAAQLDHINNTMATEDMKMKINQRRRDDIDMAHEIVLENANKADGLMSIGNTTEAYRAYEAAYEGFADGTDIVIDPDNLKIDFNHMGGRKESQNFESEEEMQKFLKDSVDQARDKTQFAMLALKERANINRHNAAQWVNRIVLENKDGHQIQAMTDLRDPSTGKPMMGQHGGFNFDDGMMFYDPKNQRTLTKEEVVKGGYLSQEQLQDIAKTQGKKTEKLSPEEKLARGISRTYGVDMQVAMDYVLANKTTDDRFKVIAKMLEIADIDDPEVQKAIEALGLAEVFSRGGQSAGLTVQREQRSRSNPKIKKIKKEFDEAREKAKQPPKGEGGRGLPKKTKKVDTEQPPVKGARKSPKDGKWYVKKDGKWFMVEQ